MGTRKIDENILYNILDQLASAYNKSNLNFLSAFMQLNRNTLEEIIDKSYLDLEEDINSYCLEIIGYYKSIYAKKEELNLIVYKEFTLRSKHNSKLFTDLLDKLNYLSLLNQRDFLMVIKNSPVFIWDKLFDFQESSFSTTRDSKDYIICLKKAKMVAQKYDNLFKLYYKNEDDRT
jgi:hypothetical protein